MAAPERGTGDLRQPQQPSPQARRTLGEQLSSLIYWILGAAVVVWLLGAALYLAIAGIHVKGLNVDGLAPQLGATLPSFIVTFVLYTVLGRLALRRPMTVMDRL